MPYYAVSVFLVQQTSNWNTHHTITYPPEGLYNRDNATADHRIRDYFCSVITAAGGLVHQTSSGIRVSRLPMDFVALGILNVIVTD